MTPKNQFTQRFDAVGIWLTLPTYFLTWTLSASWGGAKPILPLAAFIAFVYTMAHLYEIRFRGHCLLSADSTAAPVTFVAFVCCCLIGYHSVAISKPDLVNFVIGSVVAFMLGHLIALAVAAATHGVGRLVWMLRTDKNGK